MESKRRFFYNYLHNAWPYKHKKAQTSYVQLNPNLEFNLYKNLQSHIQFCFKSSIVFKVCSHLLQLRLPVTFSIWYGYHISWSSVFAMPCVILHSSLRFRWISTTVYFLDKQGAVVDWPFKIHITLFFLHRPEDRRSMSRITHSQLPVFYANLITITTLSNYYLYGKPADLIFIVDLIPHLKEKNTAQPTCCKFIDFSPND